MTTPPQPDAVDANEIRETVRERYAKAATALSGCGCGGAALSEDQQGPFGAAQYGPGERGSLPEAAQLASLGCGNPTAVADLEEGETVLDLGSGGGIDVLLSAQRVGPAGKAYGLDMTDEMLALARENAAKAGATNVEFLKGEIESIPLPAGSVDVVISNCVINLSGDKAQRPAGGRTGPPPRWPLRASAMSSPTPTWTRRHGRTWPRGPAASPAPSRRRTSSASWRPPASRMLRSARRIASTTTPPRPSSAPASPRDSRPIHGKATLGTRTGAG